MVYSQKYFLIKICYSKLILVLGESDTKKWMPTLEGGVEIVMQRQTHFINIILLTTFLEWGIINEYTFLKIIVYYLGNLTDDEKFEDTKGVIRTCKRRTDSTMIKRKKTKGQTRIYKTTKQNYF